MTRISNMISKWMYLILVILTYISCGHIKSKISNVRISFQGENVSNAKVEFSTSEISRAIVKFWKSGEQEMAHTTKISDGKKNHSVLFSNLLPGQQYQFNVSTSDGELLKTSPSYRFTTIDYSASIKDTFKVECKDPSILPTSFQEGYILVYRRESPGIVYLLDASGNIVWFKQSKDAGFKVVNFTKHQTLLALMGTKELDRGYGNTILELTLEGDTLLYLKKGQKDFRQTIHHEILLNQKDEIVTLCSEERIFDLRSKGGLGRDTIHGDGILVLNRQGRQTWKWSVFDALDPLQDKNIMKIKNDWMHANSIAVDHDGNYLVSFYNNGQIWKIDAKNGAVIWRFGKNGDFQIPHHGIFDQAHSVHINEQGWLMLFDNGVNKRLSRAMAFKLDEPSKRAEVIYSVMLPPNLFTERMGSSYLLNGNHLLYCVSGQKAVVLTNLQGQILWQLNANRLASYRAEFIPKEKIDPLIADHSIKSKIAGL